MQLSLFRSEPPPQKEPVRDRAAIMKRALLPHVPESAVGFIVSWLLENNVQLRIARTRSSKLGDYRPAIPGNIPKISVNNSLNPYSFLITLVHEMAHHAVFSCVERHNYASLSKKKRPKPHGNEWKSAYRNLISPLLQTSVFPNDILHVLKEYFENPRASSKADQNLSRILKKYDVPDDREVLENLPLDTIFLLPNGRKFQKKEKIRTRYRCQCLRTRKMYLFNPLAEVFIS